MKLVSSLNYPGWACKYHIVLIPKSGAKALFGDNRRELGAVVHCLVGQEECLIEEGHLMADHTYVMLSIPPVYAVSPAVEFERRVRDLHFDRQTVYSDYS